MVDSLRQGVPFGAQVLASKYPLLWIHDICLQPNTPVHSKVPYVLFVEVLWLTIYQEIADC